MTTARAAQHLDRVDPHTRGRKGRGNDDDEQSSLF
jgi:hypothetical protein